MIEENKLPKMEHYDVTQFVSTNDVVADITKHQMPESKVRSLLSLYCVEPVAQRQIPKTRGRGMHLYARTDVERALGHYLSFFSTK